MGEQVAGVLVVAFGAVTYILGHYVGRMSERQAWQHRKQMQRELDNNRRAAK